MCHRNVLTGKTIHYLKYKKSTSGSSTFLLKKKKKKCLLPMLWIPKGDFSKNYDFILYDRLISSFYFEIQTKSNET